MGAVEAVEVDVGVEEEVGRLGLGRYVKTQDGVEDPEVMMLESAACSLVLRLLKAIEGR